LSTFDFVVASVHSRFKMSKKEQTERILRAIENPYTTIIGHMTGRQLQRRPGYEIDIDKVLKGCAEYGVAVEIDAHQWRPDLDWRWHQKAFEVQSRFLTFAGTSPCSAGARWTPRRWFCTAAFRRWLLLEARQRCCAGAHP
jgi:histidinol phosphatase-like PHP family hydrolase